ncbi:hypothetical protein GN956_G11954 [Arapaima gigas]
MQSTELTSRPGEGTDSGAESLGVLWRGASSDRGGKSCLLTMLRTTAGSGLLRKSGDEPSVASKSSRLNTGMKALSP